MLQRCNLKVYGVQLDTHTSIETPGMNISLTREFSLVSAISSCNLPFSITVCTY